MGKKIKIQGGAGSNASRRHSRLCRQKKEKKKLPGPLANPDCGFLQTKQFILQ